MMRRISILAAVFAGFTLLAAGAGADEDKKKEPPRWSFQGIFGTYDKAQLKRGFEVYQGVCAACHSLRLVSYRNLREFGLSLDEIEKIAAEREVPGDPDDDGEPRMRQAIPSDKFVPPFANPNAARAANNGALPPDISVIAKARVGGVNYLYAFLTGYVKPPKFEVDIEGRIVKDKDKNPIPFKLGDGQQYNAVFPGGKTAMAFPLSEGAVEYTDKTKATVEQMTVDVIAFMKWAADPKLEDRKRLGIKVILFLIFLTGLLYAWKRKVWSKVH